MDAVESSALAYLRGESAREIAEDVNANRGTDVAAVAQRLGITRSGVYHHVSRLRDLGLIISRSPTRQFALETTPLYAKLRDRLTLG